MGRARRQPPPRRPAAADGRDRRIAGTGFEAAHPLIDQIKELLGPIGFFDNFLEIVVLLFAWVLTILAFFILAIQLFTTLIEFKLTSLAGFALMPFALWNRTAMLTVAVKPPRSADVLRKNPLGLYVEAIDWSREYERDARPPAAAPADDPSADVSLPTPSEGAQP